MIDLVLALVIYFIGNAILPPLGTLAGMFYCAVQDGLGNGQSVGKKILGLQVIDELTGNACTIPTSFIRNIPFAALFIFGTIASLCFLLLITALPIVLLELYLILSLESGTRLGDILANTQVTDSPSGV
jgi:uncharacterized RDD family membrane protein YckC